MVTSYALVVPLEVGERARQLVASLGIGRTDLKLGRREGRLLIPILGPIEPPLPEAVVEVAEFMPSRPPGSYKERVDIPAELRSRLPSSFDIIGDLVVIKIPRDLTAYAKQIGRAILEAHPNVKAVHHDGGVGGPHRTRTLQHLAGEERTTTTHSEYGARFRVDVANAYFSPRLANEHQRVAQSVTVGETFVDATAGVGPFSILTALRKKAGRIVAIDLNEAALRLLQENLKLNRCERRVDVVLGDAAKELAAVGPFQRVAINLPHGGDAILRAAWATIQPGGTIHYYTILRHDEVEAAPAKLAADLFSSTGQAGSAADVHVVHPYSPDDRLVSIDFRVE